MYELLPQQRARILDPTYHLGDALGGVTITIQTRTDTLWCINTTFDRVINLRGVRRNGCYIPSHATLLPIADVDNRYPEARCLVEPRRRVPDQRVAPFQQRIEHLRLDVVMVNGIGTVPDETLPLPTDQVAPGVGVRSQQHQCLRPTRQSHAESFQLRTGVCQRVGMKQHHEAPGGRGEANGGERL